MLEATYLAEKEEVKSQEGRKSEREKISVEKIKYSLWK